MMGAMNMASLNVANAIGAAAGGASISAGFGLLSAAWAGFILTALGLIFLRVAVFGAGDRATSTKSEAGQTR
jgi:DHA1 family inner membrane transport protein